MPDDVTLMGLDFGTTTSSAVVASARLARSAATGRRELSEVRERFRSPMIFTPLDDDDRLDERQVEQYLDAWLWSAKVLPEQIFGGGALLTGLTARKQNAAGLVQLVRRRLGSALIATADDPCLESWLAFMGSCAGLSRARPGQAILNLDVGGGTTNLALGIDSQVLRTGCLFVGARHVQVVPGSYRIVKLSPYARAVMEHLGLSRCPGDALSEDDVGAIVEYDASLLEAAATGAVESFQSPVARLHVQVPFRATADLADAAITFSGGVGELIYRYVRGEPWPSTTCFGDLGIDLARRLAGSPVFAGHLRSFQPTSGGRATVYGLLRHTTDVSGSTMFLPRPESLPLTDVPILGRLDADSGEDRIREVVELARRSLKGSGVQIALGTHESAAVRNLGARIAAALREAAFPADLPLVLLVQENVGKVLGHYVTEWGAAPLNLVVIDEVPVRDAQYVQIGTPRSQVVPVSFYGLNEPGESR